MRRISSNSSWIWGPFLAVGVVVFAAKGAVHDIRLREQAQRAQSGLVAARPLRQELQGAHVGAAACKAPSAPGGVSLRCEGRSVWVTVPAQEGVPAVAMWLAPVLEGARVAGWRCHDRSVTPTAAVPGVCRP